MFKGAVWELPGALPFPITAPRDTCCRPASAPPSLHLVLPLKALDLLLTATQGPSQRLPPNHSLSLIFSYNSCQSLYFKFGLSFLLFLKYPDIDIGN